MEIKKSIKSKKLWKFLRTGLKSKSGDHTWELKKWYQVDDISICNKGFHASKNPLQALSYVAGEIVAEVEVKGKSEIEEDKECWSEMRIVKAWHWKKEDSVSLAIFAAELCIKNYEDKYPDDSRPRDAIEAAKKWLAEPIPVNQSAARSATSAARSAAWSAAWSAASAARSAESAGRSAAESAAWSAVWSATESAASAAESAGSAAKKELIAKLDDWFIKRISKLEPWTK